MIKKSRLLLLILILSFSLSCLCGCQTSDSPEGAPEAKAEIRDYASELTLDMDTDSLKQEVTVKSYVDGDTTHFNVPESIDPSGVLKARYLAIDTPESTGRIEEYGKAASRFTKERLSSASSIIIESDNSQWNLDSTGSRHLVWVWYRTDDSEPYRNLNVEILQNGLAIASNTANNRYGDVSTAALNQAKSQKLNVFSGEPDPDFFYGDAVELTLKELRLNPESYNGSKVAFTGTVSRHSGNGVYVEAQDPESGMYYGIYIYYGFNLPGEGLDILSVGNEVRIVGTLSYYEAGDAYQVSNLKYRAMAPDDPDNLRLLSSGHEAAFTLTEPGTFINGELTEEAGGETRTYKYWQAAMATTISMKSLMVESVYTTAGEDSSSKGAMTLSCSCGGIPVTVRTPVMKDENGELITEDAYLGMTIDVRGVVDSYRGEPQIKILSPQDIAVSE